jgi:hypothetical protein
MPAGRVAADGTHRLSLHSVGPPVHDLPTPRIFGHSARSPWIDRGKGHVELRQDVSMVVRHRVVSCHEHPCRGVSQLLRESAKQWLIVFVVEFELTRGRGHAAAAVQLRGDPLVDVSIDAEPNRLRHQSRGFFVRPHGVPPHHRVSDFVVVDGVADMELVATARLFCQFCHKLSGHASASDHRSPTQPLRIDLDVLQLGSITCRPSPAAKVRSNSPEITLVDRELMPWNVADVVVAALLLSDDSSPDGRQSRMSQRPAVPRAFSETLDRCSNLTVVDVALE